MTELVLFPSAGSSSSLAGHTLLVPAISIGSVPQLAIDLLVHHAPLQLRHIGTFDSTQWCLPYACPADSVEGALQGPSGIGLPMQLYSSDEAKLSVIQLRSSILKSAKHDFVQALVAWAKSASIAEMLILGSLDADLRVDAELHIPLVHLLARPNESPSSLLQTLATSFPPFQPQSLRQAVPRAPPDTTASQLPVLPGAGATRLLLQAAAREEGGVEVGALLMFASEGDNRGDAHAMATMVLDLLRRAVGDGREAVGSGVSQSASLFERREPFREPRSWLTVFGQRMDQALYG